MKVEHRPDEQRFLLLEGDEEVGYLTWKQDEEGHLVAEHTVIKPEYRGRDCGVVLVDALVEHARDRVTRVVPLCPYVKKLFDRHPDRYGDIMA